jgi:hypothetical protein
MLAWTCALDSKRLLLDDCPNLEQCDVIAHQQRLLIAKLCSRRFVGHAHAGDKVTTHLNLQLSVIPMCYWRSMLSSAQDEVDGKPCFSGLKLSLVLLGKRVDNCTAPCPAASVRCRPLGS